MTVASKMYRAIGKVVVRRIGEDHLLVPISGIAAGENVLFTTNETGVFVWERLSVGKTLEETARELAEVFEVDLASAQADCATSAAQLVAQKLLEPKTPAPVREEA